MKNYNGILNPLLCYSMLVIAVILSLVTGPSPLAFGFLGAFVSSFFISFIIDKTGMNRAYKLLINIAIWLHLIGLAYGYNHLEYYDKAVHLISSAFITLAVWAYFARHFDSKKPSFFIFIFLGVMGMLGIWEIYEYLENTLFHLSTQGVFNSLGVVLASPFDDTMQDLLFGGIGSLIVLLFKKLGD